MNDLYAQLSDIRDTLRSLDALNQEEELLRENKKQYLPLEQPREHEAFFSMSPEERSSYEPEPFVRVPRITTEKLPKFLTTIVFVAVTLTMGLRDTLSFDVDLFTFLPVFIGSTLAAAIPGLLFALIFRFFAKKIIAAFVKEEITQYDIDSAKRENEWIKEQNQHKRQQLKDREEEIVWQNQQVKKNNDLVDQWNRNLDKTNQSITEENQQIQQWNEAVEQRLVQVRTKKQRLLTHYENDIAPWFPEKYKTMDTLQFLMNIADCGLAPTFEEAAKLYEFHAKI